MSFRFTDHYYFRSGVKRIMLLLLLHKYGIDFKILKRFTILLTGSLITLSTHPQLNDANSSQSVKSNDYQDGNLTVTADKYNLSNGEA